MAKAGMHQPDRGNNHKRKKHEPTVPEIQGKAKTGNKKAGPA